MSRCLHRFLVFASALLLAGCYNFKKETVPGNYPVKGIDITWCNGKLFEMQVRVQQGVQLNSLVDMSYFDGLAHRMSLETAQKQLGAPRRVITAPDMHVPAHLYPVAKGEVGFLAIPSSGATFHEVCAFPTNQTPAAIILDESLRSQLMRQLKSDKAIRVSIVRDVGSGRVTASMTSNRVEYLILGPRDGE